MLAVAILPVLLGCQGAVPAAISPPPPTPACGPFGTPVAPAAANVRITTTSGRTIWLQVEVADTGEKQGIGLSKRTSLPENSGMIFVFPREEIVPFWMKDTFIPLSIAFATTDGRIIDIFDMQPQSQEFRYAKGPFRYALEMNQGWFTRNCVQPGDRLEYLKAGS